MDDTPYANVRANILGRNYVDFFRQLIFMEMAVREKLSCQYKQVDGMVGCAGQISKCWCKSYMRLNTNIFYKEKLYEKNDRFYPER